MMESENIELPVYDNSRMMGTHTHEVDKDSILYLSRKLN